MVKIPPVFVDTHQAGKQQRQCRWTARQAGSAGEGMAPGPAWKPSTAQRRRQGAGEEAEEMGKDVLSWAQELGLDPLDFREHPPGAH